MRMRMRVYTRGCVWVWGRGGGTPRCVRAIGSVVPQAFRATLPIAPGGLKDA